MYTQFESKRSIAVVRFCDSKVCLGLVCEDFVKVRGQGFRKVCGDSVAGLQRCCFYVWKGYTEMKRNSSSATR